VENAVLCAGLIGPDKSSECRTGWCRGSQASGVRWKKGAEICRASSAQAEPRRRIKSREVTPRAFFPSRSQARSSEIPGRRSLIWRMQLLQFLFKPPPLIESVLDALLKLLEIYICLLLLRIELREEMGRRPQHRTIAVAKPCLAPQDELDFFQSLLEVGAWATAPRDSLQD